MDIYNEIMKLTAIYSFYDSNFEEKLLNISENDTKFMFLNRNTHSNNIYQETKKKIHKILKIFSKKQTAVNKSEADKNTIFYEPSDVDENTVIDINTDIDMNTIIDEQRNLATNTTTDKNTNLEVNTITDKNNDLSNCTDKNSEEILNTNTNRNLDALRNSNTNKNTIKQTTNNIITDKKIFNSVFNKILNKLKKPKRLISTTKTPTDFNTFKILKTLKHDNMYFRAQTFYEIVTNTKPESIQQTTHLDFTQDCIFCQRTFKIEEIDSHIKQELESINSKNKELESTDSKNQEIESINNQTTNSTEPLEIQIKVFFISLKLPNINTDNISITLKKPVTVYKLKQKIFEITNLSISKQKILIDTNVLRNSDLIENNIVFLKLKKKH
ncbi:hypothetical protein CWI38_0365p0030 [Hamiltosporidium tvaerminnensis]|uniref:Ubiquitin-like domain-containing protein n=1 Tax=Hamiltosporidium tvaerminnensis TaxID=1176355 RepID=A0A4Q9M0X3_9MICR|nr:hypothetical protein CWI38_0365p0030 [Hamiltosporidium tvaerminnensis]